MRRKRKMQQWFTGLCQKSLLPGKGYQVVPNSPTTSRHHTFISSILKIWKINEKGSWNCGSKYMPQPGPTDSRMIHSKKTGNSLQAKLVFKEDRHPVICISSCHTICNGKDLIVCIFYGNPQTNCIEHINVIKIITKGHDII